MQSVYLSSAYLPPVQWFQKVNRYQEVFVEQCDSFIKQTYRNRCVIASPQGPLSLTIPVERHDGPSCMRDLTISDHGKWRSEHWNALQTAYGDSPFFMYYADDLRPFYEKRWKYLIDFNADIVMKLCELLDVEARFQFTESYLKTADLPAGVADFRDAIRPKHPAADPDFTPKPYYQVHSRQWGFMPNLSVIDLLCNMGNESIFYL